MALTHTIKELNELLAQITQDLEKSEKGNKAASQRVRTGTVKLEKTAKAYRKESIKAEKQPKSKKNSGAARKTAASKTKTATKAKPAAKKGKATTAKVKAKPKTKSIQTSARPRALAVKRPTAKLPSKRRRAL